MFLFWVGSLLGRRFLIEKDYWLFKAQDIIRAEEWFRKYGQLLILLNRFLPGIRSVISIAGGMSKLKFFKVTLLALISSCTWNLIWMCLGYTLGSNWEALRDEMAHIMVRYNFSVLALLGLAIVFLMMKRLIKRGKR